MNSNTDQSKLEDEFKNLLDWLNANNEDDSNLIINRLELVEKLESLIEQRCKEARIDELEFCLKFPMRNDVVTELNNRITQLTNKKESL